MQDLLRIVKRKPPKHRQPTIQPDPLGPHEGPGRRDGDHERSQARDGDDRNAREEGSAEVEVFFLLGGGADKGNGAHHGDRVEAGAGEDSGLHKHERGEDGGLAEIEASPQGVFLHVASVVISSTFNIQTLSRGGLGEREGGLLIRAGVKSPIHSPQTGGQSHAHDHPRVRRHDAVGPPAAMQGAGRHADDADAQAGMHKGFVQEGPLVGGHAAVLSRLAVEHEVGGDDGTANDGGAIEKLLGDGAGVGGGNLAAGLHIGATEGLLEGISGFGQGGDGRNRFEGESGGFRGAMEGSGGDLGSFGKLLEACGDGHRPTKDEGHTDDCMC